MVFNIVSVDWSEVEHNGSAVRVLDSQSREPGFKSTCSRFENFFTPPCLCLSEETSDPATCQARGRKNLSEGNGKNLSLTHKASSLD